MAAKLSPDQIRAYFESRLGTIRPSWSSIIAKCPLHADAGLSLWIDLFSGAWHCEICGHGSGILAFEQKFAKCTARSAADNVRGIIGQGVTLCAK